MPKLIFKRFWICFALLLVAAGFAFVVFHVTRPPSGYIDIKYDGMSSSGVFWELENRSNQAIYIQGTADKVWPSSHITKCRALDYSSEASDPPYFADGFPSVIRVSPNARIRLNVETTLPNKYRGGHCFLRLSLLGGTFVESHEFTPN